MIDIQLHDPRWKARLKPYCKTVREACAAALKGDWGLGIRDWGLGIRDWEVTVVLADDAFIKELNKTFRGKNKPTNVLSFPSSPTTNPQPPIPHLGDIVLAFETVEREAKEQNKSFRAHAQHLLVHGVLHLLGHDHEKNKDAAAMETLEVKILKKLGVSNPYL